MTDRKDRELQRSDMNPHGALTRRGTGDLVSRGLADLERSEQAKPTSIGREECYERGTRLLDEANYIQPEHDRKLAEAAIWFRGAADQGHADAQFELGFLCSTGRGVPQDDAEAVRRYRRAADQGHAEAQFHLGCMYSEGRGVPQDDAEGARWCRRAAEQGYKSAQFNLGCKYATGHGVPQDDAEAVRWYRLAADRGDANAQLDLGLMYSEGRGVPQDDAEGARVVPPCG